MCFDSKVLRWKLINYRRRRGFRFRREEEIWIHFSKNGSTFSSIAFTRDFRNWRKKGEKRRQERKRGEKREIKEVFVRREKNSCSVGECNLFQIPEARLSDDWGMVKRKRVCNEGRIIEFALGGWMNIPK